MEKLKTLIPTNANSWPNVVNELAKIKSILKTIEDNDSSTSEEINAIKLRVQTLETNIAKCVSTEIQHFNDTQKATARDNIGSPSNADILHLYERIEEVEREIEFSYNYLVTSYLLDQTNPTVGAYHLPADMIKGYNGAMNNIETVVINGKTEYKDVIRRIRYNSHIYVGVYDSDNSKMKLKQVSDENKAEYLDESAVVITTTDEYDLFMKLPEFWYKLTPIAEDLYQVSFSMTESYIDNTWNHWDGKRLIGVYKGWLSEDNKYYSKPGVTPTVNKSWNDLTVAARARYNNNDFTLVDYEAHCVMCLLGFGWLKSTDAQSIVGYGTSTYPKTTGLCDSKGMTDTQHSVDGELNSINFWGIENWWGDIYEWIDNIKTANSTRLINIYEADKTTVKRTVQSHSESDGEIGKMELGANGDMIPKEIHSNSNYNRAYCDFGYVYAGAGIVARRSSFAAYPYGGLGYLFVDTGPAFASGGIGSRLLYNGDYEIVEDFE